MKRKLIAAIGVAGMMVGLVACGSDDKDSDKGSESKGPDSYKGQTLTVWAMDGSTPTSGRRTLPPSSRRPRAPRSSSRSSSGTASSRS